MQSSTVGSFSTINMARLLSVAFITVFCIPLVRSIGFAPQVTIESGKLRGVLVQLNNTNNATVRKYLGIPYATADRFQEPKAPPKWPDSEVKDMIAIGKACIQTFAPLGVQREDQMSEDCLNLNVFVPDNVGASSKLPVMVWIHGGGYFSGSNGLYDGSYIAVLGQVVVVVINYRLGVFGFLTNGRNGDIKGNYGMKDQIEALKWVKTNIHAFNGDPHNVTIFGESAGGSSVSLLMLSKLTKGSFHRAIPQSGDASAPWAIASYEKLGTGVKLFAKTVGCPDDLSQLKTCLASKPIMQIANASLLAPWPTFAPVIDGEVFEDEPRMLYDKQMFEKMDVLLGATDDEGIVFTNAIPGLSVGVNVSGGLPRNEFTKSIRSPGYLSLVIPPNNTVLLNATVQRYTDWRNVTNVYRNRRMYIDLMGDMGFTAPAIKGAQAYAKKGGKVFFYRLEYRYDGAFLGVKIPQWVNAYHGADIMFVFGYPLNTEQATVAANFSREVIKMWTNFAKTGDPNTPGSIGIAWPQYTLNEQKYLALKPDLAVNSYLRADYMAYWNEFIPEALRSTPAPCKCQPCSNAVLNKSGFVVLLMLIAIAWLS